MVQTYTESLLNDGRAYDGLSYSLYQDFTRTAQTYMISLLKHGSPLDGFNSLYRVLTLTANSYNLHWTHALMTNRHCGEIKMNHLWGKF